MGFDRKDKSLKLSEFIKQLDELWHKYGDIEVYYVYDGMNVSIHELEHNPERIEERGMDRGNGYPKYLVPEHILIK